MYFDHKINGRFRRSVGEKVVRYSSSYEDYFQQYASEGKVGRGEEGSVEILDLRNFRLEQHLADVKSGGEGGGRDL